MSNVNAPKAAAGHQPQTSSMQKKYSTDSSFAQVFQKAVSASPSPLPTPVTLGAGQFPVAGDDPFASTDQMLNQFLGQRGSQIGFENISLAAGYLKHELSMAGATPSQIDPKALFVQIIEKAAEFDENAAGSSSRQSPLRQELAKFLG